MDDAKITKTFIIKSLQLTFLLVMNMIGVTLIV